MEGVVRTGKRPAMDVAVAGRRVELYARRVGGHGAEEPSQGFLGESGTAALEIMGGLSVVPMRNVPSSVEYQRMFDARGLQLQMRQHLQGKFV
jgi:hypothetical protein